MKYADRLLTGAIFFLLFLIALSAFGKLSSENESISVTENVHIHLHQHEHFHEAPQETDLDRQLKMLMYENLKQHLELHHQPEPPKPKYYNVSPINISNKDFQCLAKNIFYEAGIESVRGKLAVAQVTYNRTLIGRGGNTICDVVYAPAQFSWTLNKKRRQPTGPLWEESKEVAKKFINGKRVVGLEKSIYYHADYVNPRWADQEQLVTVIGRHKFYNGSKRI